LDDLLIVALREIRHSNAEIVHMRAVLKKKVTHNVGDHEMAGGK
jgi:hypothetical protein